MNIFQSINESATNAVKSGEDYVEHTEAYIKLKMFKHLTFYFSMLIKLAVIGVFILLGVIFLAIAGAIALGNYLNNMPLGMLITGIVLILFAIIAYGLKKNIDKLIIKKFSKSFFE